MLQCSLLGTHFAHFAHPPAEFPTPAPLEVNVRPPCPPHPLVNGTDNCDTLWKQQEKRHKHKIGGQCIYNREKTDTHARLYRKSLRFHGYTVSQRFYGYTNFFDIFSFVTGFFSRQLVKPVRPVIINTSLNYPKSLPIFLIIVDLWC